MKQSRYVTQSSVYLHSRLFLLLLILFLFFKDVLPQQNYRPVVADPLPETWRWHHIGYLSAKGVRSMSDDAYGNMWFGLDKGILRYDGYHWQLFEDPGFLNHPTGILHLGSDDILYAGNEAGLLAYKNGYWEKIFPSNDTIGIPVSCIAQNNEGDLLAGFQNGLLHIRDGQHTIYTVNSHTSSLKNAHQEAQFVILPDEILFQRNFGRIDEIFFDSKNIMWLFMSRNNDGKLIRFDPTDISQDIISQYQVVSELGGVALANRNQVIETCDSTLWIINGFYKSGIIKIKNNVSEYLKLSDQFGGDELHTSIMETTDGAIWIGGLGKFYVFKHHEWQVFSSPAPPVPSSRILLHESRNGWIWIAGSQGDVFRINYTPDNWTTYRGLNYQATCRDGTKWFIDAEGKIINETPKGWHAFGVNEGVIDSPVKLIITNSGRVWIAGSHSGTAATAYWGADGLWHKQLHPDVSWGIDSRSVFQSIEGSLWFGASVDRQEHLGHKSGVLQLINPDDESFSWKHHTQQDGINQQNAYGIGQSPDGTIWLGGTNLLYLDKERWRRMTDIEYFNEFVDIVYSNINLWVGSRYYGLFKYDGKQWAHFTNQHGLPSNTIISVYEISSEDVLVLTDKGIARYDGVSWQSGIFPSAFQIAREGGEISVEHDATIWINKSHREWKRRAFPYSITPKYVFEDFWTVRHKGETTPPKTAIHLYTEVVDPEGNILIGWEANDFWEETPPNDITYSFRLNNEEWSNFTNEKSVVFTKLKTGKYSFEVKARDTSFNVEDVSARINFTVRPPIWKQAWFIGLVLTFLIIIGWYEYRLIQRNRSLFRLNTSLTSTNQALAYNKREIEIQKEKVEELSQVKQRFFTNISHEFRTPLTLIMGSIEQLLSATELDKSKLNKAYETIQRNSNRILRLINQILEIRKVETGKLSLNETDGDIIAFIKQITSLFQDMAQIREITLETTFSESSIQARFDHDKLEKIMFNLISNAFKTTQQGDTISVSLACKRIDEGLTTGAVSTETVTPQTNSAKLAVEIRVTDTGTGIPKQYLDKIFERFYQIADSYRYNKLDSSGIGLSYVKDLVSVHNGEISVNSEQGIGTTFLITLILSQISAVDRSNNNTHSFQNGKLISESTRLEIESMQRSLSSLHEKKPAAMSDSGKHPYEHHPGDDKNEKLLQILIVEDEYELRQLIAKILEHSFEVIEAFDGVDGYEKAVTNQPDLIISDVMMPGMDGHELCRKLKTNFITNHIPVLMLTAQVAPENKLEGYQTGADAYLEKPFNTAFLMVRINNLIQAQLKTREKVMRDLITHPKEIVIQSEEDKMLKRIQEVLEENISNPDFDVENLSQQFFLSRFHFSRKIKQITGHSPKEIIDTYRLKRAGQLLQQQKLSVSEIAYMVGFDHPNSFSRAFKKFYNMSPTAFASQN